MIALPKRRYMPVLTVSQNRKGVVDIDTVKGCTLGMQAYPNGGCYGQCYAANAALRYGIDFGVSVSRTECKPKHIECSLRASGANRFRIGVMGDPSHDWDWTAYVCGWLGAIATPIVVTKHWIKMAKSHIDAMVSCGAVVNTSVSALDTDSEIEYRLAQFERLKAAGVKSVLRIVSVQFGLSENRKQIDEKQDRLFENWPVIDNPLRVRGRYNFISGAEILSQHRTDIGGGSLVSVHAPGIHVGRCEKCKDQCGVSYYNRENADEADRIV